MASINSFEENSLPSKLIFPTDLRSEGNARFMKMDIKKLKKGTLSREPEAENAGPSIYLPMPLGMTDEYQIGYTEDQLGAAIATLRGQNQTFDTVQEGLKALGGATLLGAAREVANAIPGGTNLGDRVEGASRTLGFQLNPGLFNNFSNIGFKVHGFIYILVPKTEEDSRIIADIIGCLRFFSAPSGVIEGFITRPEVFEISFSDGGNDDGNGNPYLYKPGLCALKTLSVTYNSSKSSFFKRTGAPTEVAISMEFVEITQGFKERHVRDYSRYNYTNGEKISPVGFI